MKKILMIGVAFVAALYIIPTAWQIMHTDGSGINPSSVSALTPETVPQTAADSFDMEPYSTVTVQIDGKATEMPLETYIVGVVAGEVPEEFPLEAIKAQAVAARTYAVYKMQAGRPAAHPDADVCDNFHHCAAYRSTAAAAFTGQKASQIETAVKETAGQILLYDNQPIISVFHCASSQKTEASVDVWGGEDIPYLQTVVSPGGSAYEKYESAVTISAKDFRAAIAKTFPSADVSGAPSSWFTASDRSAAGGIKTTELGGATLKGTDIRELFGLNSTNFTLTTTDDSITFHTIGYGHGVGLSQYGARYLAEQGSTYLKILSHYYPGTVLINV